MPSLFRSLKHRLLDERFVLHRYKSTSHASVAAGLVMGGWYLYDLYVNHIVRWDFLIVMGVMALVKVVFVVWYRLHD